MEKLPLEKGTLQEEVLAAWDMDMSNVELSEDVDIEQIFDKLLINYIASKSYNSKCFYYSGNCESALQLRNL